MTIVMQVTVEVTAPTHEALEASVSQMMVEVLRAVATKGTTVNLRVFTEAMVGVDAASLEAFIKVNTQH